MEMENKLKWGLTYFDQFILSMSSLQMTYLNIRAANGVKSPHLESYEVLEKMKEFESNTEVKPMAVYAYGRVMCLYIRAVRTGSWALHLSALEEFVTYFFALDKLIMPG